MVAEVRTEAMLVHLPHTPFFKVGGVSGLLMCASKWCSIFSVWRGDGLWTVGPYFSSFANNIEVGGAGGIDNVRELSLLPPLLIFV